MTLLYYASIWLHLVAATVWIGSMVFFGAVIVPVLKRPEFDPVRAQLMAAIGYQFRRAGWASVAVLVITGLVNLVGRGVGGQLHTAEFWHSRWGAVLGAKLVLLALTVAVSLYHDLVLGPAVTSLLQTDPDAPQLTRLRRAASYLGRFSLLLSLVILALAAQLARTEP